jgi:flagellar protein FliL
MSEAKDSKESGGGGNQKLVMILTLVNLVVVIAIAALVFISFKKENAKPSVGDIAVEEEVVAADGHGAAKSDGHGAPSGHGAPAGHGEKGGKKKGEASGKWVTLDQFTVNLNTPGGTQQKFARVNISVEVENDDVELEVQAKMPQVRNTIIDLFNSKRPSDLATGEGRDFLREEIKTSLKSFIMSGKVKGVYFTNFAVTS